jgi:hypothetical protein
MTSLDASYTYRALKSEHRCSHGVAVAGARTAAVAQKGHGATFSRYRQRQQIAAIAQSLEARTDIVTADKPKTPEHDHKAHVGEAAFHGPSYWNHKGVVCAYRAGSSGRSQFRRTADPAARIGCRG